MTDKLVKYWNEDELQQVYCRNQGCNECDGTDQSGEPNGYGCEASEEYCGDEENQMMEDLNCGYYKSWDVDEFIKSIEKDKKELDLRLFTLRQFLINGFELDYIKFEKIDRTDMAFQTFKMLFGDDEAEKIARDK